MSAWFEDESFWKHGYAFMFSEEAFARAPGEIEQALRLANIDAHNAVDLCCGPGRHAIALALKGLSVTGVDLSPFLLGRAKEHAAKFNVTPEFVLADIRQFSRPDSFDLALNLRTSFGYFDDPKDDLLVLENVHQSLRPGGAFVMDMVGKEVVARGWGPRVEETDGSLWIQRPKVIEDWTRMTHDDLFISNGTVNRFRFTYRLYSGHELRSLLRRAGFDEVALFGDLDGRPYAPGAMRLVAVARKAK